MTAHANYIGGRWIAAHDGAVFERRNPADPADLIGLFPASAAPDGVAAVAGVDRARHEWAKADPEKRQQVLERAAELILARIDELSRELTREEGKILSSATQEWRRTAANFRLYAGEALRSVGETYPAADGLLYSMREPVGIVLAITPWNFPVSLPSRKIGPALATGNGVIYKPSEITPLAGQRMVEILLEAGLPAGVIALVQGRGADLGEALITPAAVGAVTFTGSYQTGCRIHQLAGPDKRLQLEMGGKNPCVVLEDADPARAAQIAMQGGAFALSGQACTATSRVLVVGDLYDAVVREIVARARAVRIGNGLDPQVTMGPVASEGQYHKVRQLIELGRSEGLRLAFGEDHLESPLPAAGWFVAPTVFVDVPADSRLSREEIFGPVLCVSKVASYDEALRQANDVEYGLAASVVTRDMGRALSFARDIEAGIVKINGATNGVSLLAPFGGLKHSSNQTNKEQAGQGVMDFYTRTKTVYLAV